MIWQRYFIKQHLSLFFLFIFCFYGLYVLIDYATHAHYFHQSNAHFQWKVAFSYYLFDFVKLLEVLIPFSLLIATIKTITTLNTNNELVALLANGIKLKKLLRPFLMIGLFFTFFLYLNTQYFLPGSLKELKSFNQKKSIAKVKKLGTKPILNLSLEDGTTLIFQDYDEKEERFLDAYWIKSIDEIYRIKFLYPKGQEPVGAFVTHLLRDEKGMLESAASYPKKTFSDMRFNKETLFESMTTAEEQSYFDLVHKIPSLKVIKSEKQAQLVTSFYYKLTMPWLALLAVIGPIPFCLCFTRNLPLFMIYAWSIFGLVAFYIIMNSSLVLGERQVISPAFAVGIPFILILSIFSLRYARLS
ncbi:MAG TPA: LptF/LptG family permease [Parachlamydiaceae bacterium]|nr:LptF/LptG family permease [Parachlamydiaceae bacterium]